MRLAWSRRALDDRKAIFAYIQRHNPQAALDLDHHLVSSARHLVDMPGIGRKGQVHGTREFVAHRHYILVYEVRGIVLRVLRVLHTARRWPAMAFKSSGGQHE